MCYAIPGRVKELKEKTVTVDYFGEEKKAINEIDGVVPGDYIYAQGGYVIEKIPQDEAESILAVWKETFFELHEVDLRLSRLDLQPQGIDKQLTRILDKTLEQIPLTKDELRFLLMLKDEKSLSLLYKTANFIRHKHLTNSCCIHGIIEISNYCAKDCTYCGIRAGNKNVTRYRMTPDEIVAAAYRAVHDYGFKALVLQSGEDPFYTPQMLAEVIRTIKNKMGVLMCVSFGEVGLEGLQTLYDAGARALLMRFETSNAHLYTQIHPGQTLDTRLNHLIKATQLGYLVMTGALIGIPGQTEDDIINDILLTKELNAEMYSFGPFLPHPQTPLSAAPRPDPELILKTLAGARFVDQENAKILITTAFETLHPEARKRGLLAGANSVMLNTTPVGHRKHYEIYPNRVYTTDPINEQIDSALGLLRSLGRAPTDLGVHKS